MQEQARKEVRCRKHVDTDGEKKQWKEGRLSREGGRKRMFLDPCGVLPITPAF